MKSRIKTPPEIKSDIGRLISECACNSLPVIVLDTGGLIDIADSIKQYNRYSRTSRDLIDKTCSNTQSFLEVINSTSPVIISSKVLEEMTHHLNTRLNSHQYEIDKPTFQKVLYLAGQSLDFDSIVRNCQHRPIEEMKYDAYWITRLSCDSPKKVKEGYSETDKEVLLNVMKLSGSFIYHSELNKQSLGSALSLKFLSGLIRRTNLKPILVVSSDKHILEGVNFIENDKELSDKYPFIRGISTRV